MTFMFYMPIFVIGLGSSYFVQFSFFFNVSSIFKTTGLSKFAFWFLAMNMLLLYFLGILVVWPSLMCRYPPLFSLVLLVCSCIWILGFQFCSNWFGSSNSYILLRFQMIIFYMFSWLSKSVSSHVFIRFVNCCVAILCEIWFDTFNLYMVWHF